MSLVFDYSPLPGLEKIGVLAPIVPITFTDEGVARIGQAAYQDPQTTIEMWGTTRWFQDEIERTAAR